MAQVPGSFFRSKCGRIFLCAAALLALGAAPPQLAESQVQRRAWQPLIISGRELPVSFQNVRTSQIEVLAIQRGRPRPIPFQIDEVLPDGRYALPKGPQPIKDDSPGIFDSDDQIVAMISDFGERAESGSGLPQNTAEVEMTDPLDNSTRYVYVSTVESPWLSPIDYVDYDVRAGKIESEHYRLGFTDQLPTDFALQTRKNEGRPNLIDRLKSRIQAKIMMMANFHVTEGDVRNTLVAYTDGPIRVIKRMNHSVSIGFGIRSPGVASDDLFYRDYIDNPFDVSLPWVPRLIFGDIVVRAYLDFLNLQGYSLAWSGMQGKPVPIQPGTKVNPGDSNIDWLAFQGEGEVMVQTLLFGPDLGSVKRRLFYDYSNSSDPPEKQSGNHPGVGYVMTGWEDLTSGHHHFDSILLKAPARNFDPNLLLKELRTPPTVSIRAVESTQ